MRGKTYVRALLGMALVGVALVGVALVGVAIVGAGLCVAWSQDKTKTKAAAPADTGEFTKLHAQWTGLVQEARDLQIKYRLAKETDREGLRARFHEKMEQSRAMLPQVASAAETAFQANPKDEALRDFLSMLAEHTEVFSDGYEQSLRLYELVFQSGTLPEELRGRSYTVAARAAMQVVPPKFDLAEKYLAEAAKGGREPREAKGLRDKLTKEKEYWAAEQALRAAEEKDAADPAKALPRVLLKTTKGDIVIELFENEAPNSVANFIHLVEKGFYKGLAFHRVIGQFVIQGGALKDDGTGGPGYTIPCECFEKKDGKPVFRRHFRGSLSMAHAGRDTGNSQFFICLTAADNVRNLDAKFTPDDKPDGGHTVFGRVVSGFDVMAQITRRDPQRAQHEHVRMDRIEDAKVIRKRNHPYVPKKVGDEEPKAKTEDKTKTDGKAKTDDKTKVEEKAKTEEAGKAEPKIKPTKAKKTAAKP